MRRWQVKSIGLFGEVHNSFVRWRLETAREDVRFLQWNMDYMDGRAYYYVYDRWTGRVIE